MPTFKRNTDNNSFKMGFSKGAHTNAHTHRHTQMLVRHMPPLKSAVMKYLLKQWDLIRLANKGEENSHTYWCEAWNQPSNQEESHLLYSLKNSCIPDMRAIVMLVFSIIKSWTQHTQLPVEEWITIGVAEEKTDFCSIPLTST